MLPLIISVMKRYAPIITLPFAAIVGFIGYNLEETFSSKYTPSTPSISQQRLERSLETITTSSEKERNEKSKKHNPLEVNLSPSLQS
ncbi:small integral membrane protein 12 [Leptopilina boulardi]|uniref:small integral membrane protein 12 n=1 Tax=Leptopilina boulardi TaxID=63433 RepID=UPI0021F5767E|nr:small integral membrane protein 12 [Leptopilina boulardi]